MNPKQINKYCLVCRETVTGVMNCSEKNCDLYPYRLKKDLEKLIKRAKKNENN